MSALIPMLAGLGLLAMGAGTSSPAALPGGAAAAAPPEELEVITVVAPVPRYVAPTTRDSIGRVWVPVHIEGQGPFRLVLDTGAQRSAVVPEVARHLGIALDRSPPVMMHGVTGKSVTPTIEVEAMNVGDLSMQSTRLAVVADAFGGAEGLLGMDGMQDRRIHIDFRTDYIDIARSRNRPAGEGFLALPFVPARDDLLAIDASVGNVKVLAIIDTGAQSTIGNDALREALRRQVARGARGEDRIYGATGDVQTGLGARVSPISLGNLQVRDAHVTFTELHIFDRWQLGDEPALLIGMDILGLLDTLIIDCHRRELHVKPRRG
jgi:predicted aspartyl protease